MSDRKLDVHYFKKNLEKVLSEINCYTPDEMARALARLAKCADEDVFKESEFNIGHTGKTIEEQLYILNKNAKQEQGVADLYGLANFSAINTKKVEGAIRLLKNAGIITDKQTLVVTNRVKI